MGPPLLTSITYLVQIRIITYISWTRRCRRGASNIIQRVVQILYLPIRLDNQEDEVRYSSCLQLGLVTYSPRL